MNRKAHRFTKNFVRTRFFLFHSLFPLKSTSVQKWKKSTKSLFFFFFNTLFKNYWAHWTNFRSMSSKACQKMCYFQFMINGETSERVIFKMNEDMAPVMASKFIELCTGTLAPPGYLGSKVFPVYLYISWFSSIYFTYFFIFSIKLSTTTGQDRKAFLRWEEVKLTTMKIFYSLLMSRLCRRNLALFYLQFKRKTIGFDNVYLIAKILYLFS